MESKSEDLRYWELRARVFFNLTGVVVRHLNVSTGEFEQSFFWICPKCTKKIEQKTREEEISAIAEHMRFCVGGASEIGA